MRRGEMWVFFTSSVLVFFQPNTRGEMLCNFVTLETWLSGSKQLLRYIIFYEHLASPHVIKNLSRVFSRSLVLFVTAFR